MKSKIYFRFSWLLLFTAVLYFGCTDLELTDKTKFPDQDFDLSSMVGLSKKLRDSTVNAESLVINSFSSIESSNSQIAQASATSVNYALQATVTAESTYPGYSVQKIKDGSRNTTVGPSYSWANNFPAGGKLPESVFLKFTSLKAIDRIDVYTSSGYVLQNYTIQYRVTTTGSWINLVVVTGNTSVIRSHTFAAVNLLEVQIICQLGPSNQTIYGRLNEVEIYGPAEPTLPYILNENGILAFNSLSDVDQAIAYLEYKYDQYSDAFAAQYPGLTADQFADIEESSGFNDEQPYINFENQHGIYSLRALLTAQEDYWLETTAGDETAGVDPDDLYMDDYEVRALVNSEGYLKVGTIYYVFLSDDSYYTYDGGGGGGCTECPIQLAAIKKLKPGDPLPTGVKYFKSEPTISIYLAAPGCRSNVKSKDFQYNSDRTWRYKWKVKASDGPFAGPGRVKAITKSYKKKNGRWKKRGAIIGAKVYGNVVSQDCTGGGVVESNYEEKRKRKIKAKVSVQNLAVKKGELRGFHSHEKVGSYYSTLTW